MAERKMGEDVLAGGEPAEPKPHAGDDDARAGRLARVPRRVRTSLSEWLDRVSTDSSPLWITVHEIDSKLDLPDPRNSRGLHQSLRVLHENHEKDTQFGLLLWRNQDSKTIALKNRSLLSWRSMLWEGPIGEVATAKRPWWKPKSLMDFGVKLAALIGTWAVLWEVLALVFSPAFVRPALERREVDAVQGERFTILLPVHNEHYKRPAMVDVAIEGNVPLAASPTAAGIGAGKRIDFSFTGRIHEEGTELFEIAGRARSGRLGLLRQHFRESVEVTVWPEHSLSFTEAEVVGQACLLHGTFRVGVPHEETLCVGILDSRAARFRTVTGEAVMEGPPREAGAVSKIKWTMRPRAGFSSTDVQLWIEASGEVEIVAEYCERLISDEDVLERKCYDE